MSWTPYPILGGRGRRGRKDKQIGEEDVT